MNIDRATPATQTGHDKSIRHRPSHDSNFQQAQTVFLLKCNGVLCVSVCANWLDLEPAANQSGIFVGARPTFERCGFEVRVGGGDCMCGVSSLCGKPKGSE